MAKDDKKAKAPKNKAPEAAAPEAAPEEKPPENPLKAGEDIEQAMDAAAKRLAADLRKKGVAFTGTGIVLNHETGKNYFTVTGPDSIKAGVPSQWEGQPVRFLVLYQPGSAQ